MSKFCWSCGAEMDDFADRCSFCGAVMENTQNNMNNPDMSRPGAAAMYQAPTQQYPAPAKQPKKKLNIDFKSIIVSVISVIVIAVVIVTVTVILISSLGYNGTLKQIANAYANNDYETLMSYISSLAYPYENLEEYKEIYGNDYSKLLDDSIDEVEDKLGSIKHVSVKVDSKEEVSDTKMKTIMKVCCGGDLKDDSIVADTSNITEMVKVDLTVTIRGTDKTKEYSIKKAYLVKENGSWKLLFTDNTTIKIPEAEDAVYMLADF